MPANNFDEADSTDWLDTPLQCLSQVDAAMRCQVCKDFYTTPMITSCSHTFCSLCIRRCLSNDGRCPACRTQEQELKLRNNGAMEELVEAFKRARTEVLTYAKISSPLSTSTTTAFKRKLSVENLTDDGSPSKKTRRVSQCVPEHEDADRVNNDVKGKDYMDGKSMVQCPICNFCLPQSRVNAHLDRNCYEEPSPAKTSFDRKSKRNIGGLQKNSDTFNRRPERLPNINFSLYKDVQLKKKLGEHGLSQAGSRQAMQKRYTEWITLWNANCDATHPRPQRELKSELEKWERIQEGRFSGSSSSQNCGPKIKEKDFDGKAWSNFHENSFKQLIDAARHKPEKPPTANAAATPHPSPLEISRDNLITATNPINQSCIPNGLDKTNDRIDQ